MDVIQEPDDEEVSVNLVNKLAVSYPVNIGTQGYLPDIDNVDNVV